MSSSPPNSGEHRLSPQNPWPGLAAFTAENHEFFFGRDAEIAEIFRRVRRQMLTVLFGVSGLGKTSLLQAGLLPRLGSTSFRPVLIKLDHRPEAEDPVEQLRTAINREISVAVRYGLKVPRGPKPDEDLWGYFHDKTTDWRDAKGDVVMPVLIFDQFEEIFTYEFRTHLMVERRERFVELLACLAENRVPDALAEKIKQDEDLSQQYDLRQDNFRVVISLREDFLAHLESFKQRMPSVMENRMRLERMSEEQALKAVLEPGREIVEESVAREIVAFIAGRVRGKKGGDDAGDEVPMSGVDPVLLSLLCEQLNRVRLERHQARITALPQEQESIIQGFYEESFRDVDPRLQVWVEDRLLTDSGHRVPAAQESALREGLPAADIDKLEERRILHREKRAGVVLLELTHDLLCEPVSQSRASRAQRKQVEESAARAAAAAKRERELRRKAHRLQIVCVVLILSFFAGAGAVWSNWYYRDRVHFCYYNNYAKKFGIPEGIGLLDDNQVSHRSSSLKFIYRGETLMSVEAVDFSNRLTSENGISGYSTGTNTAQSKQICQWNYFYDARTNLTYELDYDNKSNLVRGLQYPLAIFDTNTSRRVFYLNSSGLPITQTHSNASYIEITYDRNGWESKLSYLDWLGNSRPGPDGEYSDEIEHDSNGLPSRQIHLDRHGNPLPDQTEIKKWDDRGDEMEDYYVDSSNRPVENVDGYEIWKADYDEWGNRTNVTYCNADGMPTMPSDSGYCMVAEKYDPNGSVIEKTYLDTNGRPVTIKGDNYAMIQMDHDSFGNIAEWRYLDTSGKLVNTTNGYAILRGKCDANGNIVEVTSYDKNDAPLPDPDTGFFKITMAYDNAGNQILWAFFYTNGAPCLGAGYWEETNSYDEKGNQIESAFFGTATNLTNSVIEGCARILSHYDDQNNLVEETRIFVPATDGYDVETKNFDEHSNLVQQDYFDSSGNPVNATEGYAKTTMSYDAQGNLLAKSYFDASGDLVNTADGHAMEIMEYDPQGNMVQKFSYNAAGELTNGADGYARMTSRLDNESNVVEKSYLYNPTTEGYSTRVEDYDAQGNLVQQAYFDGAGDLVDSTEGYASLTNSYDPQGNLIQESYLDTAGNLTNGADGYARVSSSYDNQGNLVGKTFFYNPAAADGYITRTDSYDVKANPIKEAYFDGAGNPANCTNGYASVLYTYDAQTNLIKEAYFDGAGNPANCTNGYAGLTNGYDAQTNMIVRAFLDASGRLTNNIIGYALETNQYNEAKNLITQAYFNAAGDLTNGTDGYARIINSYDVENNLIGDRRIYHPDYSGYMMDKRIYDANNNVLEESFYDDSGNLTNCDAGYASVTNSYDQQTNLIQESYLDMAGNLTNGPDGYARVTNRYENESNLVEITFAFNPPTNAYSMRTVSYDAQANPIKEAFFDGAGNPVDGTYGYASVTNGYDAQTNLLVREFFNASGNLTDNAVGFAIETNQYDPNNNLIAQAYFDAAGNLTNGMDGYARMSSHYDDESNVVERTFFYHPAATEGFVTRIARNDALTNLIKEAYFDGAGNPVNGTSGYASVTNSYDNANNLLVQAFYDTAGQPASRYAWLTNSYDDSGKRIKAAYYNAGGTLAAGPEGYAYKTDSYDGQGNLIVEAYYDPSQNLVNIPAGYARMTKRYDSDGNVTETSYFDVAGNSVRPKN